MNIKSRHFLLGIFPIFAIMILPVINAAAGMNADANTEADANANADADANADTNARTQIRRYNPPNVSNCGLVHTKDKKMIGGSDAAYGSHPWHGAMFSKIGLRWLYWCGSSLVNRRWLVTAAHCQYDWSHNLIKIRNIYVRLGEWNLHSTSQRTYMHEDHDIASRKIHPKYNSATLQNDITLLKIKGHVSFKEHISPICFPRSDLNIFGRTANVATWGAYHQNPSISSDILQEVQVINNTQCKSWFSYAWKYYGSYDESFCASYKSGGRDTCQGDSGGGVTLEEEGKHVLIGVISWGVGCAKPNLPGVYTNVQKYVPWIKNIII